LFERGNCLRRAIIRAYPEAIDRGRMTSLTGSGVKWNAPMTFADLIDRARGPEFLDLNRLTRFSPWPAQRTLRLLRSWLLLLYPPQPASNSPVLSRVDPPCLSPASIRRASPLAFTPIRFLPRPDPPSLIRERLLTRLGNGGIL
jgi:hypothetical protein